jgi:transcription initiation factor TFIIIB Brf1 subunit/transcription initiation factor TFIIB
MEDCRHDQRIDDFITGDEVCILCGLVTGRLFMHPSPVGTSATLVARPIVCKSGSDVITDTCHLFQLGDGVVAEAIEQFNRLGERLTRDRVVHNSKLLALYAVYSIMMQRKTSWSLTDFAARVEVHPRKLWKLQVQVDRVGEDSGGHDEPTNYIDTFCYHLELDSSAASQVHQQLNKLVYAALTDGCRPKNIAAAAIYVIHGRRYNLSLKKISDVTHCSQSSVSRLARCMRNHFDI